MEASTAVAIRGIQELQKDGNKFVKFAEAVQVKTQEDYRQAGEVQAGIKDLDKEMDAYYKPIKQEHDRKKKITTDEEKANRGPLAKAKERLAPKLIAWEDEQERFRKQEERRFNELARKQAEKEAKAEAKALEREGRVEEAAIVRETPVEPAAVVVRSETPKVAGLVRRENWKYEVTNFRAVFSEVLEGRQPLSILQINDSVVGEQVRSLKADFRVPGIRVWSEKTR